MLTTTKRALILNEQIERPSILDPLMNSGIDCTELTDATECARLIRDSERFDLVLLYLDNQRRHFVDVCGIRFVLEPQEARPDHLIICAPAPFRSSLDDLFKDLGQYRHVSHLPVVRQILQECEYIG